MVSISSEASSETQTAAGAEQEQTASVKSIRILFLQQFIWEVLRTLAQNPALFTLSLPQQLEKETKELRESGESKASEQKKTEENLFEKRESKPSPEKEATITLPLTGKAPEQKQFLLPPRRAPFHLPPHTLFGAAPSAPLRRMAAPIPAPLVAGTPHIVLTSLEKLYPVLNDPSVQTIECSGPDKPLLISQRGIIRSLQRSLSKTEIEAILKEASEKVRIPLSGGLFTAALGSYVLSAVISEFAGTRFIIEKKRM